jgi:hypothetical protein
MTESEIDVGVIKLDIKSLKTYARFAFLVDQELFIRDILKAREYLNIYELVKYDELDLWLKRYKINHFKNQKVGDPIDIYVKELLSKFKLDLSYFVAVRSVVLTNTISHNEVDENAYITILDSSSILPNTSLAIMITPDTSLEEIKTLLTSSKYKELKEVYRERSNTFSWDEDTISNIKRDRKLYWLNKEPNKLGYIKLQSFLNEQGQDITPQGIKNAIKRYKYNLNLYHKHLTMHLDGTS